MFADQYPLGCKVIREEFYVDDMLSGANDITELKQIQKEVVEILNSGGFKLAKWHSNHPSLLKKENYEKALKDDRNSMIKALGVTWSPKKDRINFKIDPNSELWLLKLAWDESIPQNLSTSWQNLAENLAQFVGRRGVPVRIYCDNATNIVGANAILKEQKEIMFGEGKRKEVAAFAAERGAAFVFIPPRAPHFGGLWEAPVKSAKHLMLRTIGDTALTFEELSTVLVGVEAILNSRPIAGSGDPNDGEAITPAHLLIGDSLMAVPELQPTANNWTYLDRWQRVSYLKGRFWSEFQRDYILGLQTRTRWAKPQLNIEIGNLVIIHEENLPVE
ncbi:uncharacterized protein LOC118735213 [Rhagoletis pomonella]|uniref:uncharacterized protein LOC118735213 n=1 Tax=Rhagoletis pomonella TaxID=28610 RepID=UPI0017804AFF|nr:uncharacterized protein LOC118735213 [Rhagoletis pomonella]